MAGKERNCWACAFSMKGPGEDFLLCVRPEAGPLGRYVQEEGRPPIPQCGPTRRLFKQHPDRKPDGTLK